jgi:hypothetical protein
MNKTMLHHAIACDVYCGEEELGKEQLCTLVVRAGYV